MTHLHKLALFSPILLVSALSFADNSTRSGFYLSGGAGLHSTELTMTIDGWGQITETNNGFLTAIKLGGYLNPQFALYYLREAAWWSDPDVNNALVTSGITGIGGSYYFNASGGGYLEFGVGFGDLAVNDNGTLSTEVGGAVQFGGGVEVTDHIQIGGTILTTSIPDSYYTDVTYSAFTLAAKVEFKL